jgi:cell filamentation protein
MLKHTTIYQEQLLEANLLGAEDLKTLETIERQISNKTSAYFKVNPIAGNFDYQHLKDIHKTLFGQIYNFADKDRFEAGYLSNFAKGNSIFTYPEDLAGDANSIFSELNNNNFFIGTTKEKFTDEAADFFIQLNRLHPFREGNGRTQRIFTEQLAQQAGYKLDLSVDKSMMIKACIDSMSGNNTLMKDIFYYNCIKKAEIIKTSNKELPEWLKNTAIFEKIAQAKETNSLSHKVSLFKAKDKTIVQKNDKELCR